MRYAPFSSGRVIARWVALAALAVTEAWASPGIAVQPDAPSATQPAARRAGMEHVRKEPKVLLLPFQFVGGRTGDSWIGQSLRQSLTTDLITAGPVHVATGDEAAATPSAAAEAGARAGARYVLFGQVHVNDRPDGSTALRVTAQFLSPASGRAVATLKSTGTLDDLFALQDDVADQARRQLIRLENARTNSAERGAQARQAPSLEPSGPVRRDVRETYDPDRLRADDSYSLPAAPYNYYFGTPYGYPPPYPLPPRPVYPVLPYPYPYAYHYPPRPVGPWPVHGRYCIRYSSKIFVYSRTFGPVRTVHIRSGFAAPRAFPGHVFRGNTLQFRRASWQR